MFQVLNECALKQFSFAINMNPELVVSNWKFTRKKGAKISAFVYQWTPLPFCPPQIRLVIWNETINFLLDYWHNEFKLEKDISTKTNLVTEADCFSIWSRNGQKETFRFNIGDVHFLAEFLERSEAV